MEITTHQENLSRNMRISLDIAEDEIRRMQSGVENHIIRRVVDNLYAELMPVLREQVLQKLSAERLAEILTGEISLAIKGALNSGKE